MRCVGALCCNAFSPTDTRLTGCSSRRVWVVKPSAKSPPYETNWSSRRGRTSTCSWTRSSRRLNPLWWRGSPRRDRRVCTDVRDDDTTARTCFLRCSGRWWQLHCPHNVHRPRGPRWKAQHGLYSTHVVTWWRYRSFQVLLTLSEFCAMHMI